jgi:hypothetical protein
MLQQAPLSLAARYGEDAMNGRELLLLKTSPIAEDIIGMARFTGSPRARYHFAFFAPWRGVLQTP